ncbi:ABC transporter ATP-binding protein [Pararobbsia alpina]|uniref:Glutathione import ATP-binding protein GsiA n=1 Tax=Pararobbsia alpina TaxID=621374 RepID=A0A6S7AVB9_9BURK|nr:ABC transporter ATP-binding protein [Pararobbsia alpina]CAB3776653.1 Glutathione import ATP-binding protein GsiA [Pararobbsia alpina]
MNDTPALRIESLQVAYRGDEGERLALDDLSFSIARGEAYGLVGESGSGKSTVAMAIARYLSSNGRIVGGRIEIAGRDVAKFERRALREMRKRELSLVYQDPARALNPTLTIGRQLTESFELAGLRGTRALDAARAMLRRVKLPSPERALSSFPHQLSGGMQQRVVIAMALAKEPSLLILDEATTGLDATVEAEIIALLQSLRRESDTALLFISHKLPLVTQLCDRVGVLERGRLVEEGAPAQLFAHAEHPYTAALLACLPTLGRTKRDGPLPTLGDAQAYDDEQAHDADERGGSDALRAVEAGLRAMEAAGRGGGIGGGGGPRTNAPILNVTGISKAYRIGTDTLQALDRVSLDIHAGETLGIVGESGSGKTTLAKIVSGLLPADSGTLTLDGKPLPARVERRSRAQIAAMQSVFQNPHNALNRAHRLHTLLGRAVGKLARLRGRAREQRIHELLDAVKLPRARLSARARELSGGQQQRVAIARACAGQPRMLICDEPTSALDVSVQASILNLFVELQQTRQVAYLFISHDLAVVRYIADRVVVLYRGQVVETARADDLFARPCHPYTETLLGTTSAPRRTPTSDTPTQHGCIYASHCTVSLGLQCEQRVPADIEVGDGHIVRCHLFGPRQAHPRD